MDNDLLELALDALKEQSEMGAYTAEKLAPVIAALEAAKVQPERVPPTDTGKIVIGLRPQLKPAEMDRDAEIVQAALINTRKTS